MGKLDINRAVADAADNNLSAKAAEAAKNQAEKKVKDKAKEEAKKTAKKTKKAATKAAKRLHKFGMSHSKMYAGLSKQAARHAKMVAQAGRSFIQFLATPPVGWICTVIIVCVLMGMSDGDKSAIADTEQVTDTKEYLTVLDDTCPVIETLAPGEVDSGTAGNSDWATKGTVAYNNAKKVFDHWVDSGLSGAAAAGIVGWTASEGDFQMIGRAEGHYGSDPKENSIKYGVVPIPSTDDYEVGGGGIYQFTPYTKYAELKSPDWENEKKMNKFVAKQIRGGSWNADMDLTGDKNTFQDMAQQTNPQYATLIWQAYERGNVDYINKQQKQQDAQIAYDLFEGSKYEYDANKFVRNFGQSSGGDDASDAPAAPVEDKCGRKSGGEWRATGGQPSTTSGAWKPANLPDDLKEYAIDPSSVGLDYGSDAGWAAIAYTKGDGGQCTDFAASMMYALWEKDGEHPTQVKGNGIDVAANWAKKFGGVESETPKAGAVFSSKGTTGAGHTGVVSQVFDNGDILIIEQNFSKLSGTEASLPHTWNYRYVSTKELSRKDYTFFDPSTVGYQLVSGIKSVE